MNRWGADTFGDPCRECGFDWSQPHDAANAVVVAAPAVIGALLDGRDGRSARPGLEWTAVGYVCHVGDSIRVWSERLASVALGDGTPSASTTRTPRRGAALRRRRLLGARWSLRRAVLDWSAAVELASTTSRWRIPRWAR